MRTSLRIFGLGIWKLTASNHDAYVSGPMPILLSCNCRRLIMTRTSAARCLSSDYQMYLCLCTKHKYSVSNSYSKTSVGFHMTYPPDQGFSSFSLLLINYNLLNNVEPPILRLSEGFAFINQWITTKGKHPLTEGIKNDFLRGKTLHRHGCLNIHTDG